MSSQATKRVIAGIIGFAYAVTYGFWTMLLTGGGHGNFVWFGMFLFVEFFGLYFPLMAVLAVDLRSFIIKVVFGTLIAFNLIASSVMVFGWITETEPVRNGLTDFERRLQLDGVGFIIIEITVHLLPTLIFAFLLVRSILFARSIVGNDDSASLNLS